MAKALEGLNRTSEQAEEGTGKLKDDSIEFLQSEDPKEEEK